MHLIPNNPCLYKDKPDGKYTMYLGLYIDDFIYFSSNPSTERHFEKSPRELVNVVLMGEVSHFLDIKFQWTHHNDCHLDVNLNQEAFSEQLVANNDLTNSPPTLTIFRSGLPIDSIPHQHLTPLQQQAFSTQMRSMVHPLLWLSQPT